jgi:membrane protease YdiL (CAAX protease family)
MIQDVRDIPEAKWQEFPCGSRLGFTTGLYGAVYLASQVLCSAAKIDIWETFQPTPGVFVVGLAFALPLIIVSECMHHDFVVERWLPAQAVREAEEDENADFYTGMSTSQLVLVTSMKAVAEELFYRAAVQGVITRWLELGSKGFMATSTGISSVTGIVPPFGPFSEALAVIATACVAGTVHLTLSTPREPEVIIAAADADVFGGREDVKLMVEDWLQGRKLRRIYSPMVEVLLAVFLGFEWLRVGNIVAPITTHAAYELWIVGASLLRCRVEKTALAASLNRDFSRKEKL